MASETMVLKESTQLPKTIPSVTGNSPVDVIIGLRKDLAEFRKTSSKEALRKELREACREALLRAAAADGHDGPGCPTIEPIVEYLQERGLVRPKLSRAQVRRRLKLASSLPPNEKTSGKTNEKTSKGGGT
jgi:hypothetical protein